MVARLVSVLGCEVVGCRVVCPVSAGGCGCGSTLWQPQFKHFSSVLCPLINKHTPCTVLEQVMVQWQRRRDVRDAAGQIGVWSHE
jgi:hypothetical protein